VDVSCEGEIHSTLVCALGASIMHKFYKEIIRLQKKISLLKVSGLYFADLKILTIKAGTKTLALRHFINGID